MTNICKECADPSWTGQAPIVVPRLPVDGKVIEFDTFEDFPATGESGFIYIDLANNNFYKWDIEKEEYASLGGRGNAGFEARIVEELPETGENGVIYLIANGGATGNTYDEYLWIESQSKFEKVGTTEVIPPEVVQETGQSMTAVMSQKAVTDALDGKQDALKFYDEQEAAPGSAARATMSVVNDDTGEYGNLEIGERSVYFQAVSKAGNETKAVFQATENIFEINSDDNKPLWNDEYLATEQDINQRIIFGGTSAPTTSTVGQVSTLYVCVINLQPKMYVCTAVNGNTYTWTEFAGGSHEPFVDPTEQAMDIPPETPVDDGEVDLTDTSVTIEDNTLNLGA